MTANALEGDRDACLAADMNDYIGQADEPARGRDDPVESPIDSQVLQSVRELAAEEGPGLLDELIGVFLANTGARLEVMKAALGQGDARQLAGLAHSLRGSSGSFGAMRLAALCARIEEIGMAGSLAGTPEILQLAEAEYRSVRCALEAELRPEGS